MIKGKGWPSAKVTLRKDRKIITIQDEQTKEILKCTVAGGEELLKQLDSVVKAARKG